MSDFPIYEEEVLQRQATHLVGTLGHVAEGKSTLVRALTGVRTQRHQKEQERNITIHLGYANCKVYQDAEGHLTAQKTSDPAPSGQKLVAHFSFVDCPGHEAFLATMLGGASIMDTACLIIAGTNDVIPQPQTEEHLIAAHLMGMRRYVIVQNKVDLLNEEDAQENYKKIKGFLTGTHAETAPLYPISAQLNWNVHHVLNQLMTMEPPQRKLNLPFQMTCVRSFDVNKPQRWEPNKSKLIGAVIGGTIQQGVLAVGDWIEIRPGRLTLNKLKEIVAQPLYTQVTEIRCEEQILPYAVPGSLLAIQTTLDPSFATANGMVGQVVGTPETLPPIVGEITLKVKSLKRDIFPFEKATVGEKVQICSNVMTVEGTITFIPDKKTRIITLDRPLCLDKGAMVSILRFNKEAQKRLLEGCGEVLEYELWEEIQFDDSPDVSEQRKRVPRWIPTDKQVFSTQDLSYTDMLQDLMEEKEDAMNSFNGTKKLKLKEPALERIPKHIVVKNWKDIWSALENPLTQIPFNQHLKEFFESELSTTSSVNGAGQLILAGNWKLQGLLTILRKYVKKYKTCGQCKGTDTGLIKSGKVTKVKCGRCLAESFIDTT
jgi:translation initiation factor 2 subunit 3